MTDDYWNRQPKSVLPHGGFLKRPRSDFEEPIPSGMPPSNDMSVCCPREDDPSRFQAVKDTRTIGSAYDRYLQNAQAPTFASGESSAFGGVGMGRSVSGGPGGLGGHPVASAAMAVRSRPELDMAPNGWDSALSGRSPVEMPPRSGRESLPLPPGASNTLYVEGLPPDCRRREVAHIFRPFVGYKEVRLVSKESKHRSGDPLILCFVDFENAACAATALSALQGYKMDEMNADSRYLRLQFARSPGPRSNPGSRGRR